VRETALVLRRRARAAPARNSPPFQAGKKQQMFDVIKVRLK